ncbi:MAG: methyltransferase, TIGR04325 family [Burkholderiaceae bacterium]|nr:MAG: methyltransferase, TIGR04325 family [Burkholderiaceae bacterium]
MTGKTLIDSLHRRVDALAGAPGIRALVQRQARGAFIANRNENLFFGVHPTWDEAAAAAREFGQAGYDNAESAQLYDHHVRLAAHDYPALYWINRSLDEGLKGVFDVGGAIGIKFLAFREHLARHVDLAWLVQDVPAMAKHGRELAEQRGDARQLKFTDRFEDGEGSEILLASGVLQYLPRTLGELLSTYRTLPRRIVINTAAVHPEHQFFTVNSLGTAFCPYRIQTQAGVVRGLTQLGYRLRETWISPDKPMTIPFRPDYSLRHYTGYCLDLQK